MSEIEKSVFLSNVVNKISEHPDWIADLQIAIQSGVCKAIEDERGKVAALAYGVSLLDLRNHREFESLISDARAENMRVVLADFFSGSEFGETLK